MFYHYLFSVCKYGKKKSMVSGLFLSVCFALLIRSTADAQARQRVVHTSAVPALSVLARGFG